MNNVIVKTINSKEEFKFYYNDILEFCKQAVEESDEQQTKVNMAWENWKTNNECLLYRIFNTDKLIDNNGACIFLFYNNKIIGSGGVEIWNKNVASLSKRTFILKKYRVQNLSSRHLTPGCIEWVKKNRPYTKMYMLTYNLYQKDSMLRTMLKFLNKEIDGDWNIWPSFNFLPFTVPIYDNIHQYVIYKIVDPTIENTPENARKLILEE